MDYRLPRILVSLLLQAQILHEILEGDVIVWPLADVSLDAEVVLILLVDSIRARNLDVFSFNRDIVQLHQPQLALIKEAVKVFIPGAVIIAFVSGA